MPDPLRHQKPLADIWRGKPGEITTLKHYGSCIDVCSPPHVTPQAAGDSPLTTIK